MKPTLPLCLPRFDAENINQVFTVQNPGQRSKVEYSGHPKLINLLISILFAGSSIQYRKLRDSKELDKQAPPPISEQISNLAAQNAQQSPIYAEQAQRHLVEYNQIPDSVVQYAHVSGMSTNPNLAHSNIRTPERE